MQTNGPTVQQGGIMLKVCDIAEKLSLKPLSLADSSREVTGVYIGDLLSWVMGRAEAGDAWITIMSNINIVAVAALTDVSAIILAEGVTLDETVINTAKEKGINILSSTMTAYELVKALASINK
jgi:predicted transcriptional regulator